METIFEVGLFAITPEGMNILGHTRDPVLVQATRERIAADRRAQLAQLTVDSQPQLVRDLPENDPINDGDTQDIDQEHKT